MKRLLALFCVFLCIPLLSPTSPPPAHAQAEPQATDFCPALPVTGRLVNVSTVSGLQNAVNNALAGDTILIADGAYNLNGVYLRVDTPNVTLRSASGNRAAVVLDGNYLTQEIVQIVASNVTVADLTLREAYYHPIHVSTEGSSTLNTLIYNVHIIDPRQQAIKINPGSGGYPDNGTIACSRIELTDAGRPRVDHSSMPCYTSRGHKLRFFKELKAQGQQRIQCSLMGCVGLTQATHNGSGEAGKVRVVFGIQTLLFDKLP